MFDLRYKEKQDLLLAYVGYIGVHHESSCVPVGKSVLRKGLTESGVRSEDCRQRTCAMLEYMRAYAARERGINAGKRQRQHELEDK